MRTPINLNVMEITSFLEEAYKNPFPLDSSLYHMHQRRIRKAAEKIVNLPRWQSMVIQRPRIFGILEEMDRELYALKENARAKTA